MFFGTLADIDGHWRTWTDIGGLGRTLADLDGQWRTWTDIGRLGRTLADSDRLVLQRAAAGLSSGIAKQRGILESLIICKKVSSCLSAQARSAYVLSFLGFYETTDVFFGPLADIDGHNRETLGSGLEKSKKYFRLIMIRVT